MPKNVTINASTAHLNLSPTIFKNTAWDFYKCYLDFKPHGKHFSPLPYFLCCRAIEMAFKAIHLELNNRKFVKNIGHDLIKSYKKLDKEHQTLTKDELNLLTKANTGYLCREYGGKGFEYLPIIYLVSGSKYFPDLEALANLAKKITGYNKSQHRLSLQ